jgi:hypothetical protein
LKRNGERKVEIESVIEETDVDKTAIALWSEDKAPLVEA